VSVPISTLIITNGDAAAEKMREGRINGEILCWRDVLHEGPVPLTQTLEELSGIRADYLAWRGWGDAEAIRDVFAERDGAMRALNRYSEVTLWFEHDLYDQLQLLQILDVLAPPEARSVPFYLIQTGTFIGTEHPQRLRMHLKLKQPLHEDLLNLAQAAWGAYRAPTPEPWAALLRYDTSAMPFLRPAILRHLEELPNPSNGLSRTEAFILRAIRSGIATPGALFTALQESEETPFMGDWSFFAVLDSMASGAAPFISGLVRGAYSPYFDEEQREKYLATELRLTGLGATTIGGKKDAIAFRRVDRWLGGVHLRNESCWRWDSESRMLIVPNGRY
jgi:hypothetical protein